MEQRKLNTKLIHYFKSCDYIKVMEYIDAGADINIKFRQGRSCMLLTAIKRGQKNIVISLLKKGADPNITDEHDRDFFYYIYTMSPSFLPMEDVAFYHRWLSDHHNQMLIIDKYPNSFFSFKEYTTLCHMIEERYIHLLTANELNLL